jgi:[protein-PII] uridylyltransferase
MALDTFNVQDAEDQAIDGADKLARLVATVEKVLSARGAALPELDKPVSAVPSRLAVFKVAPRVLIDNKASATHTVIEVNGRDRRGLLHQLTRALTGLNLQISSAKISTFGLRAVDVFYVKDLFGLKIESEVRLNAIRAKLLEVLQEPGASAAPEAEPPARPIRRTQPRPAEAEPDETSEAARYRRRLPPKVSAAE